MRHPLVLVGGAALVVSIAALPATAASHPAAPSTAVATKASPDALRDYDARRGVAHGSPKGAGGLLELDPTTGTVRILERLDGYLTAPSARSPRAMVMGYVRRHLRVLGLTG